MKIENVWKILLMLLMFALMVSMLYCGYFLYSIAAYGAMIIPILLALVLSIFVFHDYLILRGK